MTDPAPELSVVLPAYNEAHRIGHALERLTQYCRNRGAPYELIVVDDGSQDETTRIVQSAARSLDSIQLLTLPKNGGKGAAVRAGMKEARGEWILMTDVDLSTPIDDLPLLERHRSHADVIIASRALPGSRLEARQPLRRERLGRSYNLAVRWIALPGILDSQCGFKLWSRRAARAVFPRLHLKRFAFDVESLWLARRAGFRIAEIPVRWHHDPRSTVRVLRDGIRMGLDLLRILFRRALGG